MGGIFLVIGYPLIVVFTSIRLRKERTQPASLDATAVSKRAALDRVRGFFGDPLIHLAVGADLEEREKPPCGCQLQNMMVDRTGSGVVDFATAEARTRTYRYAKAGVIFVDLTPIATLPEQLFTTRDPVKSAKLMGALDGLNARYGRGTLRPAVTEPEAAWGMRRGRLSPRYTTHLAEMMDARG